MAHCAANISDRIRTAPVLWWLAGVNAAVFVVLTALSLIDPAVAEWLALPGNPAQLMHRPWTALSYMVTHIDFLHLLFNMLWLLWFGTLLLHVMPQRRLLAVYAGGGLAGALLFMVLSIARMDALTQPLTGASASVLAIMTAAGCLMPSYRLHLFFIGDVKLKWIVPAMILLSFAGTWGGNTGGLAAHLGGVAYGLAYGLASRRRETGGNYATVKREAVRRPTRAGVRRVASILEQNRIDKARLDELLDKIKMSGYESLTRRERSELDDISRRIGK